MKELKNRALSLLIIITFTLSLLPILPVHADLSIDSVTPVTGVYGDTIVVEGSGATAGADVNIYWDAVKAWDGEKGLLNSTEAKADGSYEVWFDVPASVNGPHYIWIKDMDTGASTMYGEPHGISARLELTPSGGLPGDTVTINGYGFGYEVKILLVWMTNGGVDVLTTSPTTPQTNEVGSWTATFEVPDKPYGHYEINAIDEEGNMVRASATIPHRIFNAPENSVYYVPTGNIYDDAALFAFYAYTENPQIITSPTQIPASSVYIDDDGSPLFTGDIVTFGGRYANRMVRYYEDRGTAKIGYGNDGTHHYFRDIEKSSNIYAVDVSTYNQDEKDYFVFQTYMDGDRYIMSEWGIDAKGTYAGGLCFIDKIYPNLQEYTDQYYIYSWTDLNSDKMPQPEEITLETSGN